MISINQTRRSGLTDKMVKNRNTTKVCFLKLL